MSDKPISADVRDEVIRARITLGETLTGRRKRKRKTPRHEVQGAERDYAFHTLGWLQFQRLCETVLVDELGQTVQSFEPGRDGGRDAAFYGTWKPSGALSLSGTFAFQIKYTREIQTHLTFGVLAKEIEKANALVREGLCDHYFVITNLRLTGEKESELRKELKDEIGCETVIIFGASWLTAKIIDSSQLRMLVPRVYGLGDLTEIVDERAYRQARAILKSLGKRLETFVPTNAADRSARALRDHRLVLLVGDPMTGKTTISGTLALAALDHLDLPVVIVRSAEEFVRHWNAAKGRPQFFWCDDAFGETQYDRTLTSAWSRHLDAMRTAIEQGCSFLLTSRSYIWNEAKDDLKLYRFAQLDENRVVIKLRELTREEKVQILYHHVRMGNQTQEFRSQLRPFLSNLADIDEFLPEAARRLGDSFFTKKLTLTRDALHEFFTKPEQILVDIIAGLSAGQRALLSVMYAHGGKLIQPASFDRRDLEICERFGASVAQARRALGTLRGSLVRLDMTLEGRSEYVYAHPTIRDALAEITAREPEWLDIYLAGADFREILRETSAGNVGSYGVKVVVPEARWDWLLQGILNYVPVYPVSLAETWENYLAHRSSKAFLEFALEGAPKLFDEQRYSMHYDSNWDDFFSIVTTLRRFGILSEQMRTAAMNRMYEYLSRSISFLDDDGLMSILSPHERQVLLDKLQLHGLEYLHEMRYDLRSNYSRESGDIDDYYSPFFQYAEELASRHLDDEYFQSRITFERSNAAEEMDELMSEYAEPDDYDDDYERATGNFEVRESSRDDIGDRDPFSDIADPL